jgi:LasA protease
MLTKSILLAVVTGVLCSTIRASDLTLKEQDLIYNNKQMLNFSIEDYLMTHAPHLTPYAEHISHWAGFSSISPKILIALMEYQSSIISIESSEGIARPFGTLSEKIGFNEQLKDISNELATLHYAQNKNANPAFSVVKLLSLKNTHQTTDSSTKELSEKFSTIYSRLFLSNSR